MTIEDKLFCEYRDEGKKDSFEKLFKMIKPWLYRVIYRITCDSDATNDIIQDSWIIVLNNASKFNPEKGRINNYIYTIAKNNALQYGKKYSIKKQNTMNIEKDNINNNLAGDSIDPEKMKMVLERNEALMQAIQKLSTDFQDVVILFYFAEMNIKEIADKLNKPEGTIKTNLARAREKLKVYLTKSFKNNHLLYAEFIIILFILNNIHLNLRS